MINVECLLSEDISLNDTLSESAIRNHFRQYYPMLTISSIKLDYAANKATIKSNAFNVIQKMETPKDGTDPITISYKKLDEKGEDIGKTVMKYTKGIKKKVDEHVQIEILCKLFDYLDAGIVRWKKTLNISQPPPIEAVFTENTKIQTIEKIIPVKQEPQISEKNIQNIKEETRRQVCKEQEAIFLQQLQATKEQIEYIDQEKSKLEMKYRDALVDIEKFKKINDSKKSGNHKTDKLTQVISEQAEKEKLYLSQIQNLNKTYEQEKRRADEFKSQIQLNELNNPRGEIEKLKSTIKNYESKSNELNSSNISEKNKLLSDISIQQTELASTKEAMQQKLNEITTLNSKCASLNNELNEIKKKNEEIANGLKAQSQTDTQAANLQTKLTQAIEESINFKKRISELDDQIAVKNNQLTKMTVQLSEKEETIGKGIVERNSLNDKCSKAMTSLEAIKSSIDSVEKEKLLQNEKIQLMEEKIADVKALKDEYAKKLKEYESNRSEKEEGFKKYELEKLGLETAINSNKQKISALTMTKEKLEKLVSSNSDELEECRKKITEYESKMSKYEIDTKKLNNALQESQTKYTTLLDENSKANKEKALINDKIREGEEKIKKMQTEILQGSINTDNSMKRIKEVELLLEEANKAVIAEKATKEEEKTNHAKYKLLWEQKITELEDIKTQLQQTQLTGNKLEKQIEDMKTMSDNKEKLITINKEEISEYSRKIKDLNAVITQQKEEMATHKQNYETKIKEIEQLKEKYANELATKEKEVKIKEMDASYYCNMVEEQKSNTSINIETYKLDIENLKKMLETKDALLSTNLKKIKELEAKIEKVTADHKKEIENAETNFHLKTQELEIKISSLEITKIETEGKMQQLQSKPSTADNNGDDKLVNLMKENTDIQIKMMTVKREKESALSELSLIKKQLEKEKINKEIVDGKMQILSTTLETNKTAIVQSQTQLDDANKQIKEKEAHMKITNDELDRVKERLSRNEESLKESNKKLSELQIETSTSKLSAYNVILSSISKIKIPFSDISLWDENWATPQNEQELVAKITLRAKQSDIKGRVNNGVQFLRNLVEAYQTLYLLSKTQLDKSGVKCDAINLLIESRQLFNEGTKEYQAAAIKKFKAIIPFMKDIPIDVKNKDIIMKIVLAYVSCKQIRLNMLQDDFSQFRKINLVAAQKRKEYDEMLTQYSDMLEEDNK